jgi:hypothetical protein
VSVTPVTSAPSGPTPAPTSSAGTSFLAILHDLNPLQYLPVVGTIYRAVTGDTIPEGLRIVGSLAVGAAISGPIGLVTGIAAIMAEKATGIDPDKIVHRLAVAMGLANDPPVQLAAAAAPAEPAVTTAQPLPVASMSNLSDTERLNAQELERIRLASAAYAKAASLA